MLMPSIQAVAWPKTWRPHTAGVGSFRLSKNAGRRLRILRSNRGKRQTYYADWLDESGRWQAIEREPDHRPKVFRSIHAAEQACQRKAAELEGETT